MSNYNNKKDISFYKFSLIDTFIELELDVYSFLLFNSNISLLVKS
jgi:hypothetical protein